MHDAKLVVAMRLLQEGKVSLESVFAFPSFDLCLHSRDVSAELELFAIAEPDVVIWLAFDEFDVFLFEGRVKVFVAFGEKAWEE